MTTSIRDTEIMLIVLRVIDVVMIANLLGMVTAEGYGTFVSRLDLEGRPDQPEWISDGNAGVLKVKLATAIIGTSSSHLLKAFIIAPSLAEETLMWQALIHLAIGLSVLAIAMTLELRHRPSAHRFRARIRSGSGSQARFRAYLRTAGLPALHGSETGQVRKEAATAILCKCRGLGSPPPLVPAPLGRHG